MEIESELVELLAPALGGMTLLVTLYQFQKRTIKAPVAPLYHHIARIIMIVFAAVELLGAEEYYAGGALLGASIAIELARIHLYRDPIFDMTRRRLTSGDIAVAIIMTAVAFVAYFIDIPWWWLALIIGVVWGGHVTLGHWLVRNHPPNHHADWWDNTSYFFQFILYLAAALLAGSREYEVTMILSTGMLFHITVLSVILGPLRMSDKPMSEYPCVVENACSGTSLPNPSGIVDIPSASIPAVNYDAAASHIGSSRFGGHIGSHIGSRLGGIGSKLNNAKHAIGNRLHR
jgi:hypothetical protein